MDAAIEVTPPQDQDELHAAVVQALSGPLIGTLAHMLVREMRQQLGGRSIYVPVRKDRCQPSIRPERDEAVRRTFTGRNHREVQQQFGISRATLYRIVGKRPARR